MTNLHNVVHAIQYQEWEKKIHVDPATSNTKLTLPFAISTLTLPL